MAWKACATAQTGAMPFISFEGGKPSWRPGSHDIRRGVSEDTAQGKTPVLPARSRPATNGVMCGRRDLHGYLSAGGPLGPLAGIAARPVGPSATSKHGRQAEAESTTNPFPTLSRPSPDPLDHVRGPYARAAAKTIEAAALIAQ